MKKRSTAKRRRRENSSKLPSYIRKDLWVEMAPCENERPCSGRHFILGARPTFPGCFLIYCAGTRQSFRTSLYDVKRTSPQSRLWIEGFMYGSEPSPPTDILGLPLDDKDPLVTAFDKAVAKYRKTGLALPEVHPLPSTTTLNWMLQVGVELDFLRAEDLAAWAKRSLPGKGLGVVDINWDRRYEWLQRIAEGKHKAELLGLLKSFGADDEANDSFKYLVALASAEKQPTKELSSLIKQLRSAANACFADEFWEEERAKVIAELNSVQDLKEFEKFRKSWAPPCPHLFCLAVAPIHWSSSE